MTTALLITVICSSPVSPVEVRGAGRTCHGSAVCIQSAPGRSLLLTCAHVVECDGPVSIVRLGVRHRTEVVRRDPGRDLALLAVSVELPAAELGPDAAAGEAVRVCGYPGGYWSAAGVVVDYPGRMPSGCPVLVATCPSRRGCSGGPLVDAGGRVRGVVWGGLDRAHCTPAGECRKFVGGWR